MYYPINGLDGLTGCLSCIFQQKPKSLLPAEPATLLNRSKRSISFFLSTNYSIVTKIKMLKYYFQKLIDLATSFWFGPSLKYATCTHKLSKIGPAHRLRHSYILYSLNTTWSKLHGSGLLSGLHFFRNLYMCQSDFIIVVALQTFPRISTMVLRYTETCLRPYPCAVQEKNLKLWRINIFLDN